MNHRRRKFRPPRSGDPTARREERPEGNGPRRSDEGGGNRPERGRRHGGRGSEARGNPGGGGSPRRQDGNSGSSSREAGGHPRRGGRRGDFRHGRRGGRGPRPANGARPGGEGGRPAAVGGPPRDVVGVLEVLEQGYGFLRRRENNYLPGDGDVYVSTELIRNLELEEGLVLTGSAQPSRQGNGTFALTQVATINGAPPEGARDRLPFSRVISLDPQSRIRLETTPEEVSMRVLDLITPIGKGQRGLIVAPPKTGKTTLLKKIANAITANHPEMELMVLLVDERPEEVTDFSRSVRGEVIASSSDELARNHVSVAEIVIEKAKRLVEYGRDAVILLDSLTRLSRAYNVEQRGSGKILSGGIDSRTMEKPKKFFGAARNAEQGGSLTIIATALIDTGSRMDEVIFQEFKGTGNLELQLDRRLFDRRIFPCVDIGLSGTRKEEKLFDPEELVKVQKLRRALSGMDPVLAMDKLIKMLERTRSNAEFLNAIA